MSTATLTNGSAVESRGMPTPPIEDDEPESFDGYLTVHLLLQARERAQKAADRIADANRDLTEADSDIRRLEAKLIESFRASDVDAISFKFSYKELVIMPINGKIQAMPLGTSFSLKAPIHQAFELPIVAAHAAVLVDFDDPAEIVAACNC